VNIAEAGKAVGGFIDVMRGNPLALALVVMNFALLAYIFYTGSNALEQVYRANADAQKLLAKCVDLDWEHLKTLMGNPK
jgi:CHASE3 domain sensor protein